MKTIYDIMLLMYDNWSTGCQCFTCQCCSKKDFCIVDALKIAREYIKREGTI